ncbi:MAG: tetratricopeptide repeat protein [Myxococcales bacterium]|nr:tetratricopeptide repeat protein [Myxococcales bacterium]
MLRFRIGRIPVEVHASHLLLSGLLAYLATDGVKGNAWPGSALADPAAAGYHTAFAACVAIWMGIISLSVLIHELGHALVAAAFGYRPQIHLVGLGGLTQPNAEGPIPWHKDVLLTLAGPGFGLLLATAALGLRLGATGRSEVAFFVADGLFKANLVWAVVNLLPVTPLDGGRIASAVLIRLFGKIGFLLSQLIALGIGGLVVALGLWTGQLFLTLLFAMFLVRAVTGIGAYLRGQAPGQAPSPAELAFSRAAALYAEGKHEEAEHAAAPALESEVGALRGRAHHFMGWVRLKQGRGRDALDHFAQAQGQRVESHALAAAFSLIGDEARALPLWELAFRETKDSTVLHEWAGSLIRAGRAEEAKQLSGVHAPSAYRCAERVLFLRGEFAAAARAGEASLELEPNAEVAYDAACAHARAGDEGSALRLLERATQLGFTSAEHAEADPDLEGLRGTTSFHAWLGRLRRASRA